MINVDFNGSECILLNWQDTYFYIMLGFHSKGHCVLNNFSCATVEKQNHSVATLSKDDCKHLETEKFQQHRCNLISKSW